MESVQRVRTVRALRATVCLVVVAPPSPPPPPPHARRGTPGPGTRTTRIQAPISPCLRQHLP